MKAALIGPPSSGKSTLFWAVTGHKPPVHDAVGEHYATVAVPDERLAFLVSLCNPKKLTHATMEFVDFPGISLAEAKGQQDFRKHLPSIKLCDLLVLVARDFQNAAVPSYRNRIDPRADLTELHDELVFADLDTVTTRIERIEKALRKPTRTHDDEKRELALLHTCREALENARPLSTVVHDLEDAKMLSSFAFLTEKPAIVVYNVGDDRAAAEDPPPPEHLQAAVALCAEIEAQIADLDPADRPAFLADLGIQIPARDRLIRKCFEALGLISFLTMGPTDVRAWPIRQGTTAVEAAGSIHSDLARGFIRAETVAFSDLKAAGDMKSAKAAGKVRQEGKGYVVRDGDVMLIKFNV
jgi:ribosome-binding ATPase